MSEDTQYVEQRKKDLEKSLGKVTKSTEFLFAHYLLKPFRKTFFIPLFMELSIKLLKKINRKVNHVITRLRYDKRRIRDCSVVNVHADYSKLDLAKKICFFSHFSDNDEVEDNVYHYISRIKECGFSVTFCSTSQSLRSDCIARLKEYCDLILFRDNVGLDFGSWGIIHRFLKKHNPNYLQNLDQVLITNDSIYGPFYSLNKIFDKMAQKNVDFWGLTNNFQVHEHVQSYFMVFNPSVLRSKVFDNFFSNMKLFIYKHRLILECEVGLTQRLIEKGFKYDVLWHYDKVAERAPDRVPLIYGSHINMTIFFWDILIAEFDFPFIKREVLKKNTKSVMSFYDPKKLISESTDFPVQYLPEYEL